MALHLISSNKVELLMEQLAGVLNDQPLRDPFSPEWILIPSMPMKSWLGHRLAERAGINCNNEFTLPAAWVWGLVSTELRQAPKCDPLAREQAGWLIFELLPRLLDDAAFVSLKQYLANDHQGIRRWQLSERIADVFDRYQYYRPQMIRDWSKGKGSDWQAMLWREMLGVVGKTQHRVALIDRFLLQLQQGALVSVPERIHMFAVSNLPPLLLLVIQAVAGHSDIYLYYLTPTNSYWANLVSAKYKARKRLDNQDEAAYFETGHELLASWGRQGQVFQDMLLADDSLQALEFDCHSEAWEPSLLGQLQTDLFRVQQDTHADMPADDSLQLHICHSALRECQVLHDALLKQLAADPTLAPEDILIMVPEISRYAPCIEAVFCKDDARPFIPWNVSDISVTDEHPIIRTFLQLLELPLSRFTLSEILSLLDVPEICARFSLDADKAAMVRAMVEKLHVRWGIDGNHRRQLGLSDNVANSWKQAEQRLLAGFAMGEGELWQGISPSSVGQGEIAAMVAFWNLFERLNHWRASLQAARSARAWQRTLAAMLDDLFLDASDKAGRLQQIRDVLAELAEDAGALELTRALLGHCLHARLAGRDMPGRYFSGGVSFCGMRPMRSLPFKVICLLGMQDAAFPGRERPLEFDRMVDHWQPGDPVKGEMDRYLLLETLLCARDTLYISYTGRSMRDNSECQPSTLVRELLDVLERQWGESVVKALTHIHPMQAFSSDNFSIHHAYDAYWSRLANVIRDRAGHDDTACWPEHALPVQDGDNGDKAIELHRLIQFARHPVKYFYNHSLNLYLHEEDEICDDEPFALDGLASWQVKKRLLDDYMQQGHSDAQRLKAEGILPHGGFAGRVLEQQQQTVSEMLESLTPYCSLKAVPLLIDLSCSVQGIGTVTLSGQIRDYYPGRGLLHVTPSKYTGKYLLPLWLEHLALCASGFSKAGENSVLLTSDRVQTLSPIGSEAALNTLASYMSMYLQGLRRPVPLFPKSSWSYSNGKAAAAILNEWHGGEYLSGDKSDVYIAMVMRGVSGVPVEDQACKDWAERFYRPVLDAIGAGS